MKNILHRLNNVHFVATEICKLAGIMRVQNGKVINFGSDKCIFKF